MRSIRTRLDPKGLNMVYCQSTDQVGRSIGSLISFKPNLQQYDATLGLIQCFTRPIYRFSSYFYFTPLINFKTHNELTEPL